MSERPLCPCHGEPMVGNGHYKGRHRFTCAITRQARSQDDYYKRGRREKLAAQYRARKEAGVCVKCGKPRLSSVLCWDCLNEQEARYALRLGSR